MDKRVLMPFIRSPLRSIISSQTADQPASIADQWSEVTGVTWDRLWLGNAVDVLAGQSLTVRGNAATVIPVAGLADGFDQALGLADNTVDAFDVADDVRTGNSSATGVLWAVVFQSITGVPPAASRSLIGNRATDVPRIGMELLLTTAGGLVVAAAGEGGTRFAQAVANYVDEQAWHVALVRDQGNPATTELATELESGIDGPDGDPATSVDVPWTIGRRRLSSAGVRVAVAAISGASTAMSANLANMAATIHRAVVDG